MKPDIQLIALDLDGTLTQHRSPLDAAHRRALDRLSQKYRILLVGAGACARIFAQMGEYPADVIGNYGMQYARYQEGALTTVWEERAPIADREGILRRAQALREQFGYTEYAGEPVEFHATGMLTFPLLGTAACTADKLAFDPHWAKRRPMYPAVVQAFPEYTVFIGGSSSFDLVPRPYDKLYALDRYCARTGLTHENIVFAGDGYLPGGNDEQVYLSDIRFVRIDDYREFEKKMEAFL